MKLTPAQLAAMAKALQQRFRSIPISLAEELINERRQAALQEQLESLKSRRLKQ